jgi:thiol-disulfide isomerase/thioredoxin
MKMIYLLLFSTFSLQVTFSQDMPPKSFEFKITIKPKTPDKAVLLPLNPAIPNFVPVDSIYAKEKGDSRFIFKAQINETGCYKLVCFKADSLIYSSELFVLDTGFQNGKFDLNDEKPLLIDNKSTINYYKSKYYKDYVKLKKDVSWFESFTDSVSALSANTIKDSLAQVVSMISRNLDEREFSHDYNAYTPTNNTTLSLWRIYDDFNRKGFLYYHDFHLKELSDSIRNSDYGIKLAQVLKQNNTVQIGDKFPSYLYKNLKTDEQQEIPLNTKYTLVDFWFSGCGRCLVQFPKFQKIYEREKTNGLEIVTVSVDFTESLKYLEEQRKKFTFQWVELYDENGINAEKLDLKYYPKNVLLDADGIVIHKDIEPEELATFLKR